MASEIHHFAVIVPPGSTAAKPITVNLRMPARVVQEVDIRVPPGPHGTVGFKLGASGVAVLPYEANSWVIADDEKITWPLESQIDSGAWQMQAYNVGTYPHTLYVTFKTVVKAHPADALHSLLPIPRHELHQLRRERVIPAAALDSPLPPLPGHPLYSAGQPPHPPHRTPAGGHRRRA